MSYRMGNGEALLWSYGGTEGKMLPSDGPSLWEVANVTLVNR